MFARLTRMAPAVDALQRVEDLVRVRYGVPAEALVLVTEAGGRLPGAPEAVTTILYWKDGVRHRVLVFRPVADIAAYDLPAGYLSGALRDEGDADCC